MKNKILDSILKFSKTLYKKLVKINDTPHKIALGFGLGAFLGFMPGVGPIAALLLAFLLKFNRAAALLGCVLTNTWLSLVIFLISVKIGAAVTGLDWHLVKDEWSNLWQNFHWQGISQLSSFEIIGPVMIGYLSISIVAGILAYFVAFAVARMRKHRKEVSH